MNTLNLEMGGDITPLTDLTSLTFLALRNVDFDVSGRATPICAGMQKLRKLVLLLSLGPVTSGTLSDILGSHPELEEIAVEGVSGNLSPLRDSPALENINIGRSNVSGDLTPLEGLTEAAARVARDIDLRSNPLGELQ